MRKRKAFTIVELFVVILLLGIIATMAAPKLFEPSGMPTDGALGSTISRIRDAVDRYVFAHKEGPRFSDINQTTFKADLYQDFSEVP